MIERGVLQSLGLSTFWVQAETFPLWLLALDRSFVRQVHLLGAVDASSYLSLMKTRGCDLALINLALGRIGLGKIRFAALEGDFAPARDDIVLISGRIDYIRHHSTHATNPTLVICDMHIRSKFSKLGSTFRWFHLRHASFGGSTAFKALLGTNVGHFEPKRSVLRRSIAHILDHGIRPRSRSEHFVGGIPATRLLHPENLGVEILYRSSFTSTGWGSRSLNVDELGIAFGLPSWLRHPNLRFDTFPFVPIQILDGCLRGVLPLVDLHPSLPVIPPVVLIPPSTRTWLPALQTYLPHQWIDTSVVTAKAAKHDDADAPTHLWDSRCTLVLPHLGPALVPLRRGLMQLSAHMVFRDFSGFLQAQYGPTWPVTLARLRQEELRDVVPLNRKRTRGVEEELSLFRDSELLKDAEAGCDAVGRFADADWWNWKRGSSLLFWRWGESGMRRMARDGMQVFITAKLPNHQRPARPPKPEKRKMILDKILKVLERGYVVIPGSINFIKSLIDYFEVPKEKDIRLVYNGTSCGLNKCLWAPNFWLPTPGSAARVLGYGYFMVDIDLGEMFLNFPLPSVLKRFSGIDVSTFNTEIRAETDLLNNAPTEKTWAHWNRCWMGLTSSPYMAVRYYYFAEEFARGDRRATTNPLRWDSVRLNLPGDPLYDPSLPRVMKWNDETSSIAGDILAFVDDLRASGSSPEQAWQIARQVASRLQYLGIQDAPRKRRPPVQNPGAWAGSVFSTLDGKIIQTVEQAKWDKAKMLLQELLDVYSKNDDPEISYKRLEVIRGFLCHLAMTYPIISPYLKGFHLTLAAHHPQRDSQGWRLSPKEWESYVWGKENEGNFSQEEAQALSVVGEERPSPEHKVRRAPTAEPYHEIPEPPKLVKPVDRFSWDLEALTRMFSADTPTRVLLRAARVYSILYGFADASGTGFGSTVLGSDGIEYRIGTWESDVDEESSNFREFENVVCALEEEAQKGNLDDAIIFMCTDNSTVEAGLAKGNSSSRKLFELVLRVRILEMKHRVAIVVTHVSGNRMKAQGTDGVSRGHLKEGVSAGEDMMSFIPLHLTALQRSPAMKDWLNSWLGSHAEFLEPEDWFERGHDISGGETDAKGFWRPRILPGTFVWSPPPAAAAVALEELRKARIKRQNSLHVVVVPRLLRPEWYKQLYKACDLVFEIPIGSSCWPTNMHEPVVVGIVFPFLSRPPWQLRLTPKMLAVARTMHEMWEDSDMAAGHFLRQLLLEHEKLSAVPTNVVRKLLYLERKRKVSGQEESTRRVRRFGRPK